MKSHSTWLFPCHKWLSASHDDRQIERELLVSSTRGHGGPEAEYVITVQTSNIRSKCDNANRSTVCSYLCLA